MDAYFPDWTDIEPFDDAPPSAKSVHRFNVVIWRKEEIGLMTVVNAIMKLTRFCKEEAMTRMWQAYHLGKSVVLQTHLERGELYVEQFAANGIPATLEHI